MTKAILNLKKNRYLLQIITLISGTLFAQVVSFLSIPILTRLYSPDEFGLYSIFFAITSMVAIVSSLNYEQAILLPKSKTDAKAILILSIIITSIISLISVVIIATFHSTIERYFLGQTYILYLIPVSILFIGLNQIFDAYATREELYKKIAISKVATSSTASISQISSKSILNINGLITGKIFGDIIGTLLLFKNITQKESIFKDISKDDVEKNLKKYQDFPKFQMPSNLINSISQNIPIFMLSALFSPAIAGFYSLTYRALLTPILLISSATRSVFYQKASKMYVNGESIFQLYVKTTMGLVKVFIFPFLIILIFGQEIFTFIFGKEWQEAGVIAQIAIIWFYFSFIASPTNMIFNILNLQKMRLLIQFLTFIFRVIAILIGAYIFDSYLIAIGLFTFVGVAQNVLTILYIIPKLRN